MDAYRRQAPGGFPSGFDGSHIFSMFGDASSFSLMPKGKPVAVGLEAVISKLENASKTRPIPLLEDRIKQIRQLAEEAGDENIELYETDYGFAILAKDVVHGTEASGGFEFGSPMRRRAEKPAADPFSAFMTDALSGLKPERKEKKDETASPALSLAIAGQFLAVELIRWGRSQDKAPVELARSTANLIDTLAGQDSRYDNLQDHLTSYGVSLDGLSTRLVQFAANPQKDVGETLAVDFAMLLPVMFNVFRDAKHEAQEAYEDAIAI